MIAALTVIHVLDCVALILVVLLQAGRGAAGFLSKATAVLAIVFMLTSVTLSILSGRRSTPKSILMDEARRAAEQAMQVMPTSDAIPGGEAAQGLPPLEFPTGAQGQPQPTGGTPSEAPAQGQTPAGGQEETPGN